MDFDQARLYAGRVLPWDGNWINLHRKWSGGKYSTIPGVAVNTLDALIKQLQWHAKRDELDDLYVSMGAAKEYDVKKSERKSKWAPPTALREKNNVVGLKAIFADLDVKEKGYATTNDAIIALVAFCEVIALPKPNVVVASGTGGVHVYWTFDETISGDDWQQRADALVNALIKHGVKCDTGCSKDRTRLLRVPN